MEQGRSKTFVPKMQFPTFVGDNTYIWKDKCEDYFKIFNLPETMWPTIASMHMDDKAAKWLKVYVAKMASHAIFQYNVLAIDDTHNTWTNVIVKMTILRLLGSSDDKEKRGVARPEGPPLRVSGQRPETSSVQRTRIEETVKKFNTPVEPMLRKRHTPV